MPTKRKPASNPVETEAKIRVPSFVGVKRRITAAQGRLMNPRALETNTLFDSSNRALQAAGKSFRVRRYRDSGSITLKGAARVQGGLKSRVELESTVGDPETMVRILISLGFAPQFQYEKFREVWKVEGAVVCLDDTPIGRFVEIEGTPAVIHQVAALLGLSPDRFLSGSYPALWFESGRTGSMVFPTRRTTRRSRSQARPGAKS